MQANAKFEWTRKCEGAFENVKRLLTSLPLNKPFKLQVDASQVGAGATLLQTDEDGINHPISYFSGKFNSYQTNYCSIKRGFSVDLGSAAF